MKVKYIGTINTILLNPQEIYGVSHELENSYEIKVKGQIGRYSKKMFEVIL